MKARRYLCIVLMACVLVFGFSMTVFATNINQSSNPATNTNNNNSGGIAGYVSPNTSNGINNEVNQNITGGNLKNSYNENNQYAGLFSGTMQNQTDEQDEVMMIIPIITMLEEGGGSLLFTSLLTGVVLGIVGTLAVQRIRRGKER